MLVNTMLLKAMIVAQRRKSDKKARSVRAARLQKDTRERGLLIALQELQHTLAAALTFWTGIALGYLANSSTHIADILIGFLQNGP